MNYKIEHKIFGEHITPVFVFDNYILPDILPVIKQYRWVDLFAGDGNLILPILKYVPTNERIDFFAEHIFLFDIQNEKVETCINRAVELGIPEKLARENIKTQDTLRQYPEDILKTSLKVYHVTNPPYLYRGYIAKNQEIKKYLSYFDKGNDICQDLYQVALMNDLRHGIEKMIYIVPTNFIFADSSSKKVRFVILNHYFIKKAFIFEKQMFEKTGTHVSMLFLEKKPTVNTEVQEFTAVKIKNDELVQKQKYTLLPNNFYRGGFEFDDFVKNYKANNPIRVHYYLYFSDLSDKKGDIDIDLLDANSYNKVSGYKKISIKVDEFTYKMIKSNPLFLRTIDTGKEDGRMGLYFINNVFGVDGIVVTKNTQRTHPIHLFFYPKLEYEVIVLLKEYFNAILEYFRNQFDSEFLTTYKYSAASYTRKYLGLKQAKGIIETFPYLELTQELKKVFIDLLSKKDINGLIELMRTHKKAQTLLEN